MRNPSGYATFTTDGVITKERDTFTCFHCNRIVHVKPKCDPADLGALCKVCMRLVCPRCSDKGCIPFEKKLERAEARYHARRSYEEAAR